MLLSSELEIQFIHLIILENDKSNHTLISEHKRRHYCGSLGKISWNNDHGCNNPRCVSLSKMLCPDVTLSTSVLESHQSLFSLVLLLFYWTRFTNNSPLWSTQDDLSLKKDEIMAFAATWMKLEIICLSDVRRWKTKLIWYHFRVQS